VTPALDTRRGRRISVNQGDHVVSGDADTCLTAILGSCVAFCLHDPLASIGGMNHFLLPEPPGGDAQAARRYGAYLAEVLINDLIKAGARRERIEAKIFGGARMIQGLSDSGAATGAFARTFLANEGIRILAQSLGGDKARRIEFWPATGRAFQRLVTGPVPEAPARPAPPVAAVGDAELF
jgi:chemotaxis protein CheD